MKSLFPAIIAVLLFKAGSSQKPVQLDSLFAPLYRAGLFNGNVLVATKGKVIFRRSYGLADELTRRELNPNSIFDLASLTKQFTAMAILILEDRHQLSLNDSLRKFFPQLPYPGVSITQLLHHTSGLPDYMKLFALHWDSARIATNTDMIAMLSTWKPPADFKPGERYAYSNTGYALLASIIEKVSKKSFGAFLRIEIFDKLRMSSTRVFRRRYQADDAGSGELMSQYAFGYVRDPGNGSLALPDSVPAFAARVRCLDGMLGDGGVNSTTDDLFRWDRALKSDVIFAKLAARGMLGPTQQDHVRPDRDGINTIATRYGYGWVLDSIPGTGRIANHSGGWPGYVTFIERDLDTDNTIIILQNHDAPIPDITRIRSVLAER